MEELTTRERYTRIFDHEEADRVPFNDRPWGSTVARWREEGLPEDVSPLEDFQRVVDRLKDVGAY